MDFTPSWQRILSTNLPCSKIISCGTTWMILSKRPSKGAARMCCIASTTIISPWAYLTITSLANMRENLKSAHLLRLYEFPSARAPRLQARNSTTKSRSSMNFLSIVSLQRLTTRWLTPVRHCCQFQFICSFSLTLDLIISASLAFHYLISEFCFGK